MTQDRCVSIAVIRAPAGPEHPAGYWQPLSTKVLLLPQGPLGPKLSPAMLAAPRGQLSDIHTTCPDSQPFPALQLSLASDPMQDIGFHSLDSRQEGDLSQWSTLTFLKLMPALSSTYRNTFQNPLIGHGLGGSPSPPIWLWSESQNDSTLPTSNLFTDVLTLFSLPSYCPQMG